MSFLLPWFHNLHDAMVRGLLPTHHFLRLYHWLQIKVIPLCLDVEAPPNALGVLLLAGAADRMHFVTLLLPLAAAETSSLRPRAQSDKGAIFDHHFLLLGAH